ncbi:MAG: hypothetical protein ACOX5X_01730 [Acholeplasmataceae bacterium]|jgi:hypothetical protein
MNTQNQQNNPRKGGFVKYIGYILFAIAGIMLIGMFSSTAKLSRYTKLYEKEVYPLYQSYDQNNEYFDGYVMAFNGFYDQNPIYTYKQNDREASPLEFTLNIYRARFTDVTYKFYFFRQEKINNGFIIQFKDLKYNGEDIMELNRAYYNTEPPIHLFGVYLRYSTKPNVDLNRTNPYNYQLDPRLPFVVSNDILDLGDGTFTELLEIRVDHIPYDAEKNADLNNKETLFVLNSDGLKTHGDNPLYVHDLSVSRDKYTFSTNEIAGDLPTNAEVQTLNLSYQKLDLSPYNGTVIGSTIVIVLIVLLAAYFMFFNRIVMTKIQQKRTTKRIAAQQASSIVSQTTIEADFTESEPVTEVEDETKHIN